MKMKTEVITIKVDVTKSAGKLNRSMDIVKVGCGSHKSKKDYDRKAVKAQLRKEAW